MLGDSVSFSGPFDAGPGVGGSVVLNNRALFDNVLRPARFSPGSDHSSGYTSVDRSVLCGLFSLRLTELRLSSPDWNCDRRLAARPRCGSPGAVLRGKPRCIASGSGPGSPSNVLARSLRCPCSSMSVSIRAIPSDELQSRSTPLFQIGRPPSLRSPAMLPWPFVLFPRLTFTDFHPSYSVFGSGSRPRENLPSGRDPSRGV